jgi:hypothetical protein
MVQVTRENEWWCYLWWSYPAKAYEWRYFRRAVLRFGYKSPR